MEICCYQRVGFETNYLMYQKSLKNWIGVLKRNLLSKGSRLVQHGFFKNLLRYYFADFQRFVFNRFAEKEIINEKWPQKSIFVLCHFQLMEIYTVSIFSKPTMNPFVWSMLNLTIGLATDHHGLMIPNGKEGSNVRQMIPPVWPDWASFTDKLSYKGSLIFLFFWKTSLWS